MMLPAFEAFREHAHRAAPAECCGLIVDEDYHACPNLAPLGQFELCPEAWDRLEDCGQIKAICHSHPAGQASPSALDKESCETFGLPWYIIGRNDDLQRLDPAPIPLLGREFIYGWQDCFSLARDYYGFAQDYPREERFWEYGHSPYEEHFREFGFEEIQLQHLSPGDAILMRVGTKKVFNHVGIYQGDGRIVHHLMNRFSSIDLLGPFSENGLKVIRRIQ